jgi:hypothetical protein
MEDANDRDDVIEDRCALSAFGRLGLVPSSVDGLVSAPSTIPVRELSIPPMLSPALRGSPNVTGRFELGAVQSSVLISRRRSVSHGTYGTVADVTYVSSSKTADVTGRRTTCGGPP